MTTIATDGKTMAGDGRATRNGLITCSETVKVYRLPDGSIFGGAGDKHEVAELRAWVASGSEGKQPKAKDLSALLLKPDGELWYFSDGATPVLTEAPNAIGSGDELAIGAMEAGATPEEAVIIAARRNTGTGGTITVLAL